MNQNNNNKPNGTFGYQPRETEDRGYQPKPGNGFQPERSGAANLPSHGSNARPPKK